MREKYEKKIKIEGTTSTTMTQVLDFVYSSQIALTDENVLQLLDAFSLMQIKGKANNNFFFNERK